MRNLRRGVFAVGAVGLMFGAGAAKFGPGLFCAPPTPTCIAIEGNTDYATAHAGTNTALVNLLENREDVALAANHCAPEAKW
jgi:hypothetical protein